MESQMFDIVKHEKQKAVARFNRFRKIVKLWQVFEVFAVLGMISWSSTRVPAVFKTSCAYLVDFSTYLLNHHVVFLIGNAIIVLLVVLCRQNDDVSSRSSGDFYDDYVKHSEAAAAINHRESVPPPSIPDFAVDIPAAENGIGIGIGDEEKQIVVCTEEIKEISQCDDVAAAIENAARQIKRFQRTQSEKLKREIAVRPPQAELRRSETENSRKSVEAAEIERLSSEEFRRTVDEFIDKHWSKKKSKQHEEYDQKYNNRQLVKENSNSVRLRA